MRTLVAFANGAGGRLLVGVEDGSRKILGVPDTAKTEEQLANFISDQIEPRLVPEIHVIPWRKKYVLAVEVYPSPSRPHYIKALGFPAGVYVRVGSTNRQADAAVVAELQRVARDPIPPETIGRAWSNRGLGEQRQRPAQGVSFEGRINLRSFLLVCFAGWMNRRQQAVIEYLQKEVRALQEQLGKRPRFTEDQAGLQPFAT